ncbi:hypothetical protein Csa_016290 [Cucumis sativus]|uniref:Uncharacterized protein n=1 Tax=Cucumis sativus TaxID=3659 RepID=A0A0A0KA82_CUCSA|nr:hypothetical protein Csa_016290 [Cucumis sativus]
MIEYLVGVGAPPKEMHTREYTSSICRGGVEESVQTNDQTSSNRSAEKLVRQTDRTEPNRTEP